MLCLTFGGAPCPSEWGSIAESIYNLMGSPFHVCFGPTSHPTNKHHSWHDPLQHWKQKRPHRWHPSWPKRHGGHIHRWFHRTDSSHCRFGQCNKARKSPTPGPQHSIMRSSDDKPIPLDNMDARSKLVAGLTEQKIILGWFVNPIRWGEPSQKTNSFHFWKLYPKCYNVEQVPQRTWDKHWPMGPFGSNDPIHHSFPQPTLIPHEKSREKESNRHQQAVPRRSQIPTLCPHNIPKRNPPQLDSI